MTRRRQLHYGLVGAVIVAGLGYQGWQLWAAWQSRGLTLIALALEAGLLLGLGLLRQLEVALVRQIARREEILALERRKALADAESAEIVRAGIGQASSEWLAAHAGPGATRLM
jgi:hypothetical protein